MKNTNPIFSLKNFRSFGEEGADFELAPITVLTGCNSSGKSSLVKALMLLSRQSKNGKITPMDEFGNDNYIWDDVRNCTFNNISWNDLNIVSIDLGLGNFDKVLNVSSTDKVIKISYQMWSKYMQEVIIVSRIFVRDEGEKKNGIMANFTIEKLDGTVLINIMNPNYNVIKPKWNLESLFWYCNRYIASVSYAKAKVALINLRSAMTSLVGDVIRGKHDTWEISGHLYRKGVRECYTDLVECSNDIDITLMESEQFEEKFREFEKLLKKKYVVEKEQYETANKKKAFVLDDYEDILDKIDIILDKIELNESHFTIGDLEDELRTRFEEYNLKYDGTRGVGIWESHPEEVYTVSNTALYTSQMWDIAYSNHNSINRDRYNPNDDPDNADYFEYLGESARVSSDIIEKDREKYSKSSSQSLVEYIQLLINEVNRPWFIQDIKYINSSSAVVKRLYSFEAQDKMSLSLNQYIDERRNYAAEVQEDEKASDEEKARVNFLNYWMKEFGIFGKDDEGVDIKGAPEGLGVLVYMKRKDEEVRLLADEGYGVTQLFALLLQIANSIPLDSKKRPAKYICVEEPEIHLHPKYQSLLADMFVEVYRNYNIHFIIETHSEYLIRKLQVLVADKENKLTPNDVSLNYVDKDENGISTNRKIEILEDGRLSEPFGPGFFDEADSLAMDLMKYKVRR